MSKEKMINRRSKKNEKNLENPLDFFEIDAILSNANGNHAKNTKPNRRIEKWRKLQSETSIGELSER